MNLHMIKWDKGLHDYEIELTNIRNQVSACRNTWFIYIHTYVHTRTQIDTDKHTRTQTHVHAHAQTHTYIYVYAYICIYIYTSIIDIFACTNIIHNTQCICQC